jgi:hypothetical protein
MRKQTPTTNNGEQMNLLDIIAATEAKNQAIATVATNADQTWLTACYNVIVQIATTTDTFTTDTIWQALENAALPTPHEPRAIGAVLRQVASDGLICPTDTYQPSARVACHARPIRVWRRV